MPIAYQKRVIGKSESNDSIEKDGAFRIGSEHYSTHTIRKLCINNCLKMGDSFSNEEKRCLTMCYHKNHHLPSIKAFLI